MDLSPELRENYEQLAAERGWSLSQMGDYVEAGDPALAAELRKLDAGSKPEKAAAKRAAAPKGRRSASHEKA